MPVAGIYQGKRASIFFLSGKTLYRWSLFKYASSSVLEVY